VVEIFQARSGCNTGFFHDGDYLSGFAFMQIRSTFCNQGLLKNFRQGPVDPDQQFNRDRDRDEKFSGRV
jgi:hypothetical protein